jgi:hypothetical protein
MHSEGRCNYREGIRLKNTMLGDIFSLRKALHLSLKTKGVYQCKINYLLVLIQNLLKSF